jgi:hypothetical protein
MVSSIFCLINTGKSYVSLCSGAAFQPAHCILSFKNLTVGSISSSVLTFKVNLSFRVVYCLSFAVSLGSAHVLLV